MSKYLGCSNIEVFQILRISQYLGCPNIYDAYKFMVSQYLGGPDFRVRRIKSDYGLNELLVIPWSDIITHESCQEEKSVLGVWTTKGPDQRS